VSLDTLYTAETPEGIALTLRPAGLVPRALAYAIDFLIRLVVITISSMLLSPFKGIGQALFLILIFGLEWFYPVVFELTRQGATPGKRVMGLQVVMDSGLPVTPAASLTRNLLRSADFMPFFYAFGALAVLMRPDFKRFGDMAAGTLVVHSKVVSLHGEWPAATALAPAHPLSQREQAAIVAWAGRAQRLTPERLEELAQLADSALPAHGAAPGTPGHTDTKKLLGVAQWLMGRRTGGGA
jgi:uncharacterized RDD family membrane protein YckC